MSKILIADDEKEIVSLLKFYLEPEGFTVYEAYNGKDAARIFDAEDIDLLIVDIMMPGMNGYEVIKLVRSKSDGKNRLSADIPREQTDEQRRRKYCQSSKNEL